MPNILAEFISYLGSEAMKSLFEVLPYFGMVSCEFSPGSAVLLFGKWEMVRVSLSGLILSQEPGGEDSFTLPPYVIDYLRELGFSTLNHIRRPGWLKSSSSY